MQKSAKAPPAFKGFGPPPVKQKSAKRSPKIQSQTRHTNRLGRRGGPPHPAKRSETQHEAVLKINAHAAQHAELTVFSEEDHESCQHEPYGPRGLLLVGFEENDFKAAQDWFAAMEPGFRVSCCSDALLSLPFSEAITAPNGQFTDQPHWEKGSELVPHVAVFSGLAQEEYFGIVQFWEETGIKQPIFASAAAGLAEKPLRVALLEISRAYARSLKPEKDDSNLTRDSLRRILRERMYAKSRGEKTNTPVYL